MTLKLRGLAAAVLLLASACAAQAQSAPAGLVDDPCGVPVPVPASLMAAMKARYEPARKEPLPAVAPAELAAYRQAQAEQQKRDWPNLCLYRADDIRLATRPAAERQVVFMGDSITQGWGLAQPAMFEHGVINRGISGQTTPQMLLRFQADVTALKPRAVHIMAGTNDVAGNTGPTSVQDIRNNVMAMTAIAKASHVRVILASIPPAKAFTWSPALKPAEQIRGLNVWLKAYARQEGLIYVDYYSALATADGGMRPELTLDGVHPNAAGYAVMEPIARRALKQALAR